MFTWIFLISFFSLTLLDLLILIQSSNGAGIYLIVLTQIASALFGYYRIRKMDFNLFFFLDTELKKNKTIIREVWEEVVLLLSACLLIIPGFVTDFIGLVCLIPQVRNVFLEVLEEL